MLELLKTAIEVRIIPRDLLPFPADPADAIPMPRLSPFARIHRSGRLRLVAKLSLAPATGEHSARVNLDRNWFLFPRDSQGILFAPFPSSGCRQVATSKVSE